MPDVSGNQMKRDVLGLQLEEMKRNQAKGRALEFRSAGKEDEANAIAAGAGVALPSTDYAQLAADPRISEQIGGIVKPAAENDIYVEDRQLEEMKQKYQQMNAYLDSVHASPQAKQQVLADFQNKLRDALKKNEGAFLYGWGQDKVKQEFGLQ